MAKKTTKAQREQRVRAVYELLLSDAPRPDILQYCSNQWDVSAKTTDNYIKAATKLISEEAARMRKNSMNKHLAQRALLRYKALKDNDKRLAFEILRDESKLLDLYPADRKEISGPDGGPINTIEHKPDFSKLTDEELKAYISIAEKFSDDTIKPSE